ncbi:MAG: hypothetical protein CYG59_12735 [Chloroflexi bacterium]|nr:MAG: hypothetical protein CYG59_12735 [Chloroflexota bacterium]
MSHPPSEHGAKDGFARAIAMFNRAGSRSELVAALQAHLVELTQAHVMQLMWQADGVTQSLFNNQPTLRMPAGGEWLQLMARQTTEGGNISYLPMLVLGELRGWVALQSPQHIAGASEVVEHAGIALALLERQAAQASASRELAMMNKIGQMLSTTLHLEQLLPNLAIVVRELIVADEFYIALIDQEVGDLGFAYLATHHSTLQPTHRWAIDTGLTGQIIRSGAPIVTDNYLEECAKRGIQPFTPPQLEYSSAWMGVPLSHHDCVLGVMVASIYRPQLRYTETDLHVMASVAAQAAAAVANAQLYKQVQQQASQLSLINRIGRTISATLDLQEVPMLIMQELKAALDVEDGAILIEDQQTGELVVRYTWQPDQYTPLPQETRLAAEAMRQRLVCIANDLAHDAHPAQLDHRQPTSPTRSLLCAPLVGRHQVAGVIQLRNKRNGSFTQADAQLLQSVAEQAVIALENAQLYANTDSALAAHVADLEHRNKQLTNIVTISNLLRSSNDVHEVSQYIVATIQQMTGSPRVVVGLVEPDRQYVQATAQIGLDPGYITPRRELRTPLSTVQELLRGARQLGTLSYHLGQHPLAPSMTNSTLLVLLDASGMLVGVINFDHVGSGAPLSQELLRELEIVANQAAIAVVNARLANEQEQTVDRLTALNALSLAVTTSQLSTDEIMQMTVSGAIGTTNGLGGGWSVPDRDDSPRRMVLNLPNDSDTELMEYLGALTAEYVELSGAHVPTALAHAGVCSVVIVPVRGAKLSLGGMWIGYSEAGIAVAEREMVVLYAKTAGAVLENLRLFDQVSAAHDRLASILASTAEGMLMATAQGRIAAANAALRQLLGLDDHSLEGVLVSDLGRRLPGPAAQEQFGPISDAILRVAQGEWTGREGEVNLALPVARDLAWSVLPVHSPTNQQPAALLVVRDVTAERQTEKLRQDLANMIVHDLRAPLTNMIVSNDLLLKQISGPLTAAQQRILEIAGTSSQQMLDLVNALLDIRRLEQRKLDLQRQPVELFEIVEAVFERLERLAGDRNIRLSNTTAPLPPVNVDLDLVRRVVQNLVDNAVKFSPRGQNVRVSGYVLPPHELPPDHEPGAWVVVGVADQGKGVPESYRSVIFELFGQAPTGRGQGTGLGLAFCKLAVAAHGGKIWVEDGPDGGAVFRFTLPLA